jgi:uridine kinase
MMSTGPKTSRDDSPSFLHADRIRDLLWNKERVIIGVAGGSATGKSSAVSREVLRWAEQQVIGGVAVRGTILAQDDFQRGREFVQNSTSPYRWDDPGNFDLSSVKGALKSIAKHGQAEVPTFSLATVSRGDSRSFVAPQLTILEGLYALHPDVFDCIDYGIYVETPLSGRVIRRVFRFLHEHKIDEPVTAIRQCLTTVLAAHRDLVIPQRLAANSVVTVPYSFEETARRFPVPPLAPQPERIVERRTAIAGDAAILLSLVGGAPFFEIEHQSKLLLSIPLDMELARIVRTVDWNEL